jgi:hypothetical protein
MAESSSNDDSSVIIKQDWNPGVEYMLAGWCDEAKCFEWMHTEAFAYYDKRARALAVATNVLIAVSGVSNIMAGGVSINGFQLAWIFGSLSVLISIANMLQEKLAYLAKSIQHNYHGTQWGIIRRKIEEQLSIPPEARKECGSFMKYLRTDINQVSVEGNSMIPEFIRVACYAKFATIPEFDVPDICGKMEHTKIYVRPAQVLHMHHAHGSSHSSTHTSSHSATHSPIPIQ